MRNLLVFILPACGLFWLVVGARQFLSTFLKWKRPTAEIEATPETSKIIPQARYWRRSLGGLFWACVGVGTLWFSGIHFGASPSAVSQSRDPSTPIAKIVTRHVERDFEQGTRVGLVVGAVAGDREVLLGFGRQRLGDSLPPNADTVFEIGSISKVFTGILLAKLVESGELEIDDRVVELLPAGWSLSDAAQDVTLRHLTTHTSGFPRLPANLIGITEVVRMQFGGDPYRSYSEEEFREAIATVELEFEPGSDDSYSNFAVGLLGFVLSTQQGTDYETGLINEICEPLGMNRTVITSSKWHDEHLASGYRGAIRMGPGMVAMGSSEWQLPNHLAGAGAIRSTGSDILRFLKVNMGLIETPIDTAIQRSHQELFERRVHRAIGMNWQRSFESTITQNIIWHNGGTGGYRSYLGFTEDRQFGVFVLSNTSGDVDDLAEEILKALVRKSPGGQKPVTKHGYAKVAPYTGVRWEKDRPIVRVQGRWSPLVSIDSIPIERIMHFAQQEFGNKASKRFAEDLVQLLAIMGHEPEWEVTLGLETSAGQVEHLDITMTEENRDLVRE